MKKLVLFAAVLVAVSFASCGGNKAANEAAKEEAVAATSCDNVKACACDSCTCDSCACAPACCDSAKACNDSLKACCKADSAKCCENK